MRVYRRRTAWQQESYYADDTFQLESMKLDVAVRTIYRLVLKEVEAGR